MFIHWLYKEALPSDEEECTMDAYLLELANVWILADKLLVPELQNEIIVAIGDCLECCDTSDHVLPYLRFIYDNTPPDSALCRMIICRWSRYIGTAVFEDDNPNTLPPRFVYYLAAYMVRHIDVCSGNECIRDPFSPCENGFDTGVEAFYVAIRST